MFQLYPASCWIAYSPVVLPGKPCRPRSVGFVPDKQRLS